MRLLALLEYAALIAGASAVVTGRFFALSQGVHLGVFLIGAGIALGGLESVVTRRLGFRTAEDSAEDYAGAPAVIIGMMALLVGAAVIGAAYVLEAGRWDATIRLLQARPAPLLAAGGWLLACVGALMTFNLRGRTGLAWWLLVRGPRTLLGAVLVVGGLAGIALAAWEWRDPQGYHQFLRVLQRDLDWPRWLGQPNLDKAIR